MPVISPTQFLQIADRLAAEYDLYLKIDKKVNNPVNRGEYQCGASYPSRLLVDLTGNGTHVLLQMGVISPTGNSASFMMIDPGIANSPLASLSVGWHFVISLQTDANKKLISTAEDVVSFITNNADFSYVQAVYPVTQVGGIAQPFVRTYFSGAVGSGEFSYPFFSILTNRVGPEGNGFTLTINQPTANSQALTLFWNGVNLVINLSTNSSGNPITTLAQLATALTSYTPDFALYTQTPNVLVPAVPLTYFSGAGVGSYAQIFLTPPPGSLTGSADPDVSLLAPSGKTADTTINAITFENDTGILGSLQAALIQHFTNVAYPNGMQGYLTDNNLRVHRNFAILNNIRTTIPINAANVFRPDVVVLAVLSKTGGALVFTPGISLGTFGDAFSDQSSAPAAFVASLAPAGGTLAANWSVTLVLVDSAGTNRVSVPIVFSSGATTGATVLVTVSGLLRNLFYSVTSAAQVSGGTDGDRIVITQMIERNITL